MERARCRGGDRRRAEAFHALLAAWAPMTALGSLSKVVPFRLPDRWHRLRAVELDGRLHERLGARWAKATLRRWPFTLFNPDLHLPSEPSSETIGALNDRMCTAEASHVLAGVVSVGITAKALMGRRWSLALQVTTWNVLMNGYPALLQRYNRVLLRQRFPPAAPSARDAGPQ